MIYQINHRKLFHLNFYNEKDSLSNKGYLPHKRGDFNTGIYLHRYLISFLGINIIITCILIQSSGIYKVKVMRFIIKKGCIK